MIFINRQSLKNCSALLLIVMGTVNINPALARGGGGGGGGHFGGGGSVARPSAIASHSSGGHEEPSGYGRGYRGYGGYGYGGFGYGYGGYGGYGNFYGGGGGAGGYGGGGGSGISAADVYNQEEDKRRKNLPATSFVHEYHWPSAPPGTNATAIASGSTPQFAKLPQTELAATAQVGDFSKSPAAHTTGEGSVHGILMH